MAVHPKKILSLASFLSDRTLGPLLILRGPPGSGKTTSIELLAKELGSTGITLQSIADLPLPISAASSTVTVTTRGVLNFCGFNEDDCSKIAISPEANSKIVYILEHFEVHTDFHLTAMASRLEEWCSNWSPQNTHKLVVILTDGLLSYSQERMLLTEEALKVAQVVTLNPVAKTFLKKVLCKDPGKSLLDNGGIIDTIVDECGGDIRQFIYQVLWQCLGSTKLKSDNAPTSTHLHIKSLFHALGHIFFPHSECISSFRLQMKPWISESFINYLFENYIDFLHEDALEGDSDTDISFTCEAIQLSGQFSDLQMYSDRVPFNYQETDYYSISTELRLILSRKLQLRKHPFVPTKMKQGMITQWKKYPARNTPTKIGNIYEMSMFLR